MQAVEEYHAPGIEGRSISVSMSHVFLFLILYRYQCPYLNIYTYTDTCMNGNPELLPTCSHVDGPHVHSDAARGLTFLGFTGTSSCTQRSSHPLVIMAQPMPPHHVVQDSKCSKKQRITIATWEALHTSHCGTLDPSGLAMDAAQATWSPLFIRLLRLRLQAK